MKTRRVCAGRIARFASFFVSTPHFTQAGPPFSYRLVPSPEIFTNAHLSAWFDFAVPCGYAFWLRLLAPSVGKPLPCVTFLCTNVVGSITFSVTLQVSDVRAKLSRDRLSSVQASIGSVQVTPRQLAVALGSCGGKLKATQANTQPI